MSGAPLCLCYQPAEQRFSKNGNNYWTCPKRQGKCNQSYEFLNNTQPQRPPSFQQLQQQPRRPLYDPNAFNHNEPPPPPQVTILQRASDSIPIRNDETRSIQDLIAAVERMDKTVQEHNSLMKLYMEQEK